MAQTTPDVERLVEDYVGVWNEGDYAELSDVVTESVAIYDPAAPGGEVHGHEAFEAFLRELRTGFPDFHVAMDEMLADDGIVMAEWTVTGTHEGEFDGIPPTDREIDMQGMSKILIAEDRVTEDRIYYDRQELFEQLGLADD